jgi:glyoxylase-like metal-dependent hydrolase (beta-lactamase superfamily II)
MKQISRRNFLYTLGAAGAAAALPVGATLARRAPVARQSGMMGRVVILPKGDVTVHTYVAPDASLLVTSHIIETPNNLVIIDAQFLQSAAQEVRAYADSLGKPIERLILSHAHPDHWSGANLFPDVPFVSTAAAAEGVQADIDGGGVEQRAGMVGESEVPAEPRAPEGSVEAGETTIDGVTFAFDVVNNAEAPEHLNVRLPDYGVVVVQDLIYNNAHFFPGLDRANWISILEDMRGMTDYDTVLVGHGLPATIGELDNAIKYLQFAEAAAVEAGSADDVIAALQAEYPTYQGAGILPFWGMFVQGS